jgi:inhibitor of cysteine peptidase
MSSISLTEADKDRTIDVPQGSEVVIRLEETPTTGYVWALDQTDDKVLPLQSSDFSPTPGAGVGAGGTRTFTFTAGQPGTAHLQLKLWREWQGDPSTIERYDVDIQVHGN